MSDETLDILIACAGLAWLIWLGIFGASRSLGSRAMPSRPGRSWPWVIALPAALILGCLAYFLLGRP